MDIRGIEVTNQLRSAIRAKLLELGIRYDEELPDYILVMVVNKKSRQQMHEDLHLFLEDNTAPFVDWLHDQVLKKLKRVTVAKKKITREFVPSVIVKQEEERKKRKSATSFLEDHSASEVAPKLLEKDLKEDKEVAKETATKIELSQEPAEATQNNLNQVRRETELTDSSRKTPLFSSQLRSSDEQIVINRLEQSSNPIQSKSNPTEIELKPNLNLDKSAAYGKHSKNIEQEKDLSDHVCKKLRSGVCKPKITSIVSIKNRLGFISPRKKFESQQSRGNFDYRPSHGEQHEFEDANHRNIISRSRNLVANDNSRRSQGVVIKARGSEKVFDIKQPLGGVRDDRSNMNVEARQKIKSVDTIKNRLGSSTKIKKHAVTIQDMKKVRRIESRKLESEHTNLRGTNVKYRLGPVRMKFRVTNNTGTVNSSKSSEIGKDCNFFSLPTRDDLDDDNQSVINVGPVKSRVVAVRRPVPENWNRLQSNDEDISDAEDAEFKDCKVPSKVIVTPRPLKPLQPTQKRAAQSLLLRAVAEANQSVVKQKNPEPSLVVNQLDLITPVATSNDSVNQSQFLRPDSLPVKLPQITLPVFSGDYKFWENFRDLFDALIIQNNSLTNVSRLHYLKSSLRGEAVQLLKHVAITEANFVSTWESLKTRFDNKRALITAHLQEFIGLPNVSNGVLEDLKRLRDTTNESLAALKNLHRPTDQWSDLLVFLTTKKLDFQSIMEWEMQIGSETDYPTYMDLDAFLEKRIRVVEAIQASKANAKTSLQDKNKNVKQSGIRSHNASSTPKCLLCKENHPLFKCSQFKALSVDGRKEVVTRYNGCYNCLTPGHRPFNCTSKLKCSKCGRKHNTLLHVNNFESAPTPSTDTTSLHSQLAVSGTSVPPVNNIDTVPQVARANHVSVNNNSDNDLSFHFLNNHPNVSNSTLLATAIITVQADNGKAHKFKALLDQGSECCFISERVMKILNPSFQKVRAVVYGVGGVNIGSSRKLAQLNLLLSENHSPKVLIHALVLLHLTSYTSPEVPDRKSYANLSELKLADPNPFSSQQIDLILGADKYGSCLLPGLQQGVLGTLTAQSNVFGWILSGPVIENKMESSILATVHQSLISEVLHEDLTKFWELEELPNKDPLTDEEKLCEEHFFLTHQRTNDGRYLIRLPFKNEPPIKIGASFSRAKIVLDKVLRRLSENSKLFQEYSDFLSEYAKLGHMELVREEELDNSSQIVYLPHHPVLRECSSTTKLRVVFNASSLTSNNTSLNSHLHIGPKILNNLVSIILNWRLPRFVYMADIEKMFRQILVDSRDCNYQRILWCSPSKKVVAYRLLTHLWYGTACAPYLANKVIKQLAQDEGNKFPLAKNILEQNIYVDDVLFGADTKIQAKEKRVQVSQLLKAGGFHLRKWASNDPELLEDCPLGKHERAIEFPLDEDAQLKVLGLFWDPESDSFIFKVISSSVEIPTKRIVLSVMAKLYDPMGWLTPVIVVAKLMMQELWLRRLYWDERLPDDLRIQWSDYHNSLKKLESLKIPRWTGLQSNLNFEIHGFSDASSKAYSASVYLRILNEDLNNAQVSLLMAKSKVAPLKYVSIPRLELCGAALLAKTLKFLRDTMSLENVPTLCHTDSVTVLAWLGKHPSNWPVFVANRVSLIHELVPRAKWRYISTKDNPADCATRGLSPEKILKQPFWWEGPSWLKLHSTKWPDDHCTSPTSADLEPRPQRSHHVLSEKRNPFNLMFKFSSWPKLLRVTAYCNRFVDVFVYKHSKLPKPKPQFLSPSLDTLEIQQARNFWFQLAQVDSFSLELKALSRKEEIAKNSSLKNLNPFLDSTGLLRLGGRLRHAPISYDEKHPIISPRHHLSELIATQAHIRSLHGGLQLTLHTLRQRFWILGARSLVKGLIKGCLEYTRERAILSRQLMGNLPDFRVTPNRPFTHTGVDYAGPFNVRYAPGRGNRSHKTYVALFICCCTRAVHLELVSDYSSTAFLAAFQRFSSRRGKPAHLYSDNGTTFHGAEKELRNFILKLRLDNNLHNEVATEGTSWHFIPPSAPHFGGLWEAGVKSFKHYLKRIVGAHTLTYEEFTTLLTRIEACLNSHPIAPLSNDPEDFAYLTPGHFLIGAPLTSIPEPSVEFISENRLKRWELVQQISEIFWRRWSIDYIQSLQKRYKWFNKTLNLMIGDIVLIKHDSLPLSRWLLGRIIKCYQGKDDLVRSVRVKTASSEYDRPITQICLLPVRSKEKGEI